MGKRLVDRHELLEEFLRIIGVDEDLIYSDVEGIEHHLSWDAITCLEYLVEYFRDDPKRIEDLHMLKAADEAEEAEMEEKNRGDSR